MQRKKSRFWLFLFSFMPGAGEMYMGFMKMGISLMLGFMILVAIVGYTNLGVLAVFPVAMYIYSFFHANNLSALDDVTFHSIEDQYLFGFDGIEHMNVKLEGRNRKIAAVILIVLGVMMLWQVIFNLLCDVFGWDNRFLSAVYYFVRDDLPRAVVGIGVIWAGLALIRGKRIGIEEEVDTDRQSAANGQSYYREQPDRNERAFYEEWPAGHGQPFYGGQHAANGQMPYRDQPAGGGYQNDSRMPVADGTLVEKNTEGEVQPVADGKIIYAQGPVAGGQDTAVEGNRDDR